MVLRDLIPWNRKWRAADSEVPVRRELGAFTRVFEEWLRDLPLSPWRGEDRLPAFAPAVDVAETDEEYRIRVELPGMEASDVDVTISDNVLTSKGKKSKEIKEEEESYVRVERSFGVFSRSIPLSAAVDEERAQASFKNGVLKLTLPKHAPGRRSRIDVKEE